MQYRNVPLFPHVHLLHGFRVHFSGLVRGGGLGLVALRPVAGRLLRPGPVAASFPEGRPAHAVPRVRAGPGAGDLVLGQRKGRHRDASLGDHRVHHAGL